MALGGLAAIKCWTRCPFEGTFAFERKVNETRIRIEATESLCWLENLQRATALLVEPERHMRIADRVADDGRWPLRRSCSTRRRMRRSFPTIRERCRKRW